LACRGPNILGNRDRPADRPCACSSELLLGIAYGYRIVLRVSYMPPNTNPKDPFATIRNLVESAQRLQNAERKLDLTSLDPTIVQALEPIPVITFLGRLGVIELVPGPGLRTVRPTAKEDSEQLISTAQRIIEDLSKAPDQQLSRKQLKEAVEDDVVRETATWLLKVLGLCTGLLGPNGGIQLSSKASEQVAEAKEEVPTKQGGEPDTKYESALYPFVANALEALEYKAIITGVKQRGYGEWGTPDVVGYLVYSSKAHILPILRVLTVEVKRKLSRSGIAEARAHKRFAHRSYIAVPQPWPELMSDPLVRECSEAGLGLICTKYKESNTFHVHLEAPFHRPDEREIESFLSQFSSEDGTSLIDAVYAAMRLEIYQVLFAAPKA